MLKKSAILVTLMFAGFLSLLLLSTRLSKDVPYQKPAEHVTRQRSVVHVKQRATTPTTVKEIDDKGPCKRPRSSVPGNLNHDRGPCLFKNVSPNVSRSLVGNRIQRHVAFLKVHKSASSTLQNIFYRFGSVRNLSFILPDSKDLRFSVRRGVHEKVIPPFNGTKFDILANHAVFDENIFGRLLFPDTTYIAILREPTSNFLSAALYFRYKWKAKYLTSMPNKTMVKLLIREPERYEPKNLRASFTYNFQANDLGLTLDKIRTVEKHTVEAYLRRLNDIFSLVLLAEYFDESLVLMKRYLNWEMKDILYMKINEFRDSPKPDLTAEDIEILRKRNHVDYMFYDFFHDRYWRQMQCEGPDIYKEILHFKNVRISLTRYCLKQNFSSPLVIMKNQWTRKFTISKDDCKLMMIREMDFFNRLKTKQRSKAWPGFSSC